MKTFIEAIAYGFISFVLIVVIIPVLKSIAFKINLTDKPNNRKLHQDPVPLIGGIAIAVTVSILGLIAYASHPFLKAHVVIFLCAIILLLIGAIDDKFDLRAKYKLLIQLFCGFVIAASGTRITSLYGFFGIHEIPVMYQYVLTIVIICGVVNAFNLMDGIDGLLGELAIVGFSFMTYFAYLGNDKVLTIMCLTMIGAILGFLKFNLKTNKIFMGDAGSLFIGMLLIGFSIHLLQSDSSIISETPALTYTVIGFFALPVLDSIRVYLGRLKKGNSPFKADRTHIHHLFLLLNLSHRKIALIISIISISIITFNLVFNYYISITMSVIIVVILFSLLGYFLNQNRKVYDWQKKIKEIEGEI